MRSVLALAALLLCLAKRLRRVLQQPPARRISGDELLQQSKRSKTTGCGLEGALQQRKTPHVIGKPDPKRIRRALHGRLFRLATLGTFPEGQARRLANSLNEQLIYRVRNSNFSK